MDALSIMLTGIVLGRTDESTVGKKLFAVIWIDSDDSEDTKTELWIANDENDLYDLIMEDVSDRLECEGNEESADIYEKHVENSWGIEILPREIGTII